jgi:hypothetical protein
MRLFTIILLVFTCSACVAHNTTFGEEYVGKPYIRDPLGEGIAPDTDPLIRFDAFDCVTFVETVLADGDLDKLNAIRYKNGQIDFIKRNHFIELDWLRNNNNLVENVSNQYGKIKIRTTTINKQNWFKQVHNIDTKIPVQTVNLEYIPYSDLTEIKNKETLLVLFVIDNQKIRDKIGTDLAVLHMGFLLPNGKLRHASRQQGRVVDVDFKEYIEQRTKNKNNIGISLVRIK